MNFLIVLLLSASSFGFADEIQVTEGIQLTQFSPPPGLFSLFQKKGVADFRLPTSNTVLFVDQNKLTVGNLHSKTVGARISMPENTQHISTSRIPGSSSLLLFAYGKKTGKDAAFVYQGSGKFRKLFETPQPITAFYSTKSRIFFALGNSLFELHAGSKPQLIFASDIVQKISSLVVDDRTDVIYFASEQGVYTLRAGMADLILRGHSGILDLDQGDLIIQNASTEHWLRLSQLNELLQKSK